MILRITGLLLLFVSLVALASCHTGAGNRLRPTANVDRRVNVVLVADEAVAALAILEKAYAKQPLAEADWQRLFNAEGYRRLKEREAYMQRTFTDSAFRAFILSDTLVRRTPALRLSLAGMQRVDVSVAAKRALDYLPSNARIVARLYPEIKPRTNSFVFSLASVPGIFIYVDPSRSEAVFQNTLTHELHHIGLGSSCRSATDSTLAEPLRTLVSRMGAFGEGFAMLAAAGSADANAHAESDSATRARWNRDVAAHDRHLMELESFFEDVANGRIASADSVTVVAMTFYGEQGPWYSVGWRMAVAIEKAFGRERLIAVMCDPRALLRTYNEAASIWNRTHTDRLAMWSADLIARLEGRLR
jgi:hypothetical protein